MPTKATHRRTKDGRATRVVYLKADEARWAMLESRFGESSIAELLSPLIRGKLRAMLKARGVDPDAALTKPDRNGG